MLYGLVAITGSLANDDVDHGPTVLAANSIKVLMMVGIGGRVEFGEREEVPTELTKSVCRSRNV